MISRKGLEKNWKAWKRNSGAYFFQALQFFQAPRPFSRFVMLISFPGFVFCPAPLGGAPPPPRPSARNKLTNLIN